MVAGFHLIWTAYGWWLPNDPRGSSSHEIRIERIEELGPLHHGRKVIQPLPSELRAFYERAAGVLKHELLQFDAAQRDIIGAAIGRLIANERYTCYACAVMPDHVHCLIRKHKHHGETMIANMQEESRTALKQAQRRDPEHPVWGGPGWKRFLFTEADMRRIVNYIEANLRKVGRARLSVKQNVRLFPPYSRFPMVVGSTIAPCIDELDAGPKRFEEIKYYGVRPIIPVVATNERP